jgi:hypothetical protein
MIEGRVGIVESGGKKSRRKIIRPRLRRISVGHPPGINTSRRDSEQRSRWPWERLLKWIAEIYFGDPGLCCFDPYFFGGG